MPEAQGPYSTNPSGPTAPKLPMPRRHMRQTRGCGCNAGRALPGAGREHSGRGVHYSSRPHGDKERVPFLDRAQAAAAAPAPLTFWNLPHAAARGRMGGEARGRGRGAAATRSAPAAPRGRRAAAPLPTARRARTTSVRWALLSAGPGRPRPARPPPPTSRQAPSPDLGGLPPQTLR